MATAFKQHTDNAIAQIANSGDLNNTTNPITVSLETGKGALFAVPGNGQYITIWDKTNFPDPKDDPSAEKATITARTDDSVTISRPSAVAHSGRPYISELVRTAHFTDIETAVNTAEETLATAVSDLSDLTTTVDTKSAKIFDAIVATDGGDYTTLGDALMAGATRIRVMPGTYDEGNNTNLNAYTSTGKDIYIEGIDPDNTTISVFGSGTSYWSIKSNTFIKNITIYTPGTNTGSTVASGSWIRGSKTLYIENCILKGNNSNSTSSPMFGLLSGSVLIAKNCSQPSTNVHGGGLFWFNSAADILIDSCDFTDTTGGPGYPSFIYGNAINIQITNCKFKGSGYSGGVKRMYFKAFTFLSICNNQINVSGKDAINIGDYSGRYVISNNSFITGGALTAACILIDNSSSSQQSSVISNNTFNYESSTNGTACIKLNTPYRTIISGNSIYSSTTTANQRGIWIVDGDKCVITNNVIEKLAGTGASGILMSGTGTNTLGGNRVILCTTNYSLAGTFEFPISGNIALDATIAAPTAGTYGTPTGLFGTDSTNMMGTPTAWAPITVAGTAYKIPLY